MDETELALRRTQMGRGIQVWATGPGSVSEVGVGSWVMLTGAPSPDANLALVHDAAPSTLANVRDLVESAGCPTLFMLGGPAATGTPDLGDGDEAVSTVTTCELDDVISVWCMATPERFGRRGFGRAVLGDVLTRARDSGAQVGLLGATPAGKPMYDATGWRTLEEWQLFLNAESVQFSN